MLAYRMFSRSCVTFAFAAYFAIGAVGGELIVCLRADGGIHLATAGTSDLDADGRPCGCHDGDGSGPSARLRPGSCRGCVDLQLATPTRSIDRPETDQLRGIAKADLVLDAAFGVLVADVLATSGIADRPVASRAQVEHLRRSTTVLLC